MNITALLYGSPNALILVAVLGLLLIFIELNRPGVILPGALGLTLVLVCMAALWSYFLSAPGLLLLLAAVAIQLLSLRTFLGWIGGCVAALCAFFGSWLLVRGTDGHRLIAPSTALLVALVLGPGTSMLTGVAWRARRNKALDSI